MTKHKLLGYFLFFSIPLFALGYGLIFHLKDTLEFVGIFWLASLLAGIISYGLYLIINNNQ